MITAERARELQKEKYTDKINAKVEKELEVINNLILDQTYRKYNYIQYYMPQDGPVNEIIQELEKNGYTVKPDADTSNIKRYTISW